MRLVKQQVSIYQPQRWQTDGGRFTVEDVTHRNASGARHAKTIGYKYEVVDHETFDRYRTDTLRDAKWWIGWRLDYTKLGK